MSDKSNETSWTLSGSDALTGIGDGSRYLRHSQNDWQPTDLDGFYIKPLYEDAALGEKTMLMKVTAGAFAPEHTHQGEFEQVFVLEGSFYDQNGTMQKGDYCCRAPEAPHTAGSDDGAVVMLVYTKRHPRACLLGIQVHQ